MHSNDYESLILSGGDITIRQYASYVLSNPQVKEAINKFYSYRQSADRMIDSLQGMLDTGETPFPLANEGEIEAFCDVVKDMEQLKELALTRIMKPLCPGYTKKRYENDVERRESYYKGIYLGNESINRHVPGLTIDKLSKRCCILMKHFSVIPSFLDYLLTDKIPYIQSGTSFLSKEEELLSVFSLFLWLIKYEKSESLNHYNWVISEDDDALYLLKKYKDQIKLDGSGQIQLLFDNSSWGLISIGDSAYPSLLTQDIFECLLKQFYPDEVCPKLCQYYINKIRPKCSHLGAKNHEQSFCKVDCMMIHDKSRHPL